MGIFKHTLSSVEFLLLISIRRKDRQMEGKGIKTRFYPVLLKDIAQKHHSLVKAEVAFLSHILTPEELT